MTKFVMGLSTSCSRLIYFLITNLHMRPILTWRPTAVAFHYLTKLPLELPSFRSDPCPTSVKIFCELSPPIPDLFRHRGVQHSVMSVTFGPHDGRLGPS